MDIFQAALPADWEDNESLSTLLSMPARNHVSLSSAAASNLATVVIDDDDMADEAVSDAMIFEELLPGQTDATQAARLTPRVKRSPIPQTQKRKRSILNDCRLNSVKMIDTCDVKCVGIEKKDGCFVPVPLWCQYLVSWKGTDFEGQKWLVIGNYERWLMQLVDIVTPKSVRQVSKVLSDNIRVEFDLSLAKARRSGDGPNPFDTDDDEDDSQRSRLNKSGKVSVPSTAQLVIGGFHISCLNHAKQMVVLLDDDTAKFITGWVTPLARYLASNHLTESPTSSEPMGDSLGDSSSPEPLAGFRFPSGTTPNIRDKVVWDLSREQWNLILKKPTEKFESGQFRVDADVCPAVHAAQKLAAYHRAIEAWNRLDGSTRPRITMQVASNQRPS